VSEDIHTLNSYLEGLVIHGLNIPRQPYGERPNFRAISAITGIKYRHLLKAPFKQRIELAVQKVGLSYRESTVRSKYEIRFEEHCALLRRYVLWLEVNGLKLPESPKHLGKLFFPQIESEAGLNKNALRLLGTESDHSHNVCLRRMVEEAVLRLGMAVRVLPHNPSQIAPSITYEVLLRRGTEERTRELNGRPNARQQLYNTRWALNHFRKSLNLEKTASVGRELITDLRFNLERAMAEIKGINSKKKFQTGINWWFEFYQRVVKEPSIPKDFNEAFAFLIDRSCLSFSILAKLINVSIGCVSEWYRGKATPSSKVLAAVYRAESLFGLPTGTLVNKISPGGIRIRIHSSQLPEFLKTNLALARKVRKHLPDDFCGMPMAKQIEVVKSIENDVLRSDDSFTQRLTELVRLPYRLTGWTDQVERELRALVQFKMADRAPIGMRRNGIWRLQTKEKFQKDLLYFFGAICLPTTSKDIRQRGLGFPKEHLSLSLLTQPLLVDWYIRFRYEVRNDYTRHAVCLLQTFKSLLRRETGWIRQNPQLASKLPIKGQNNFLRGLITRQQAGWDSVCDAAIKSYDGMIKELEQLIKVSRDPFYRILGILNLDNPMKAIEILVDGMKQDLPNSHTQLTFYHTAIRDCALVLLIGVTGLRRNTVAQLDYTGDHEGHLYFQDGVYVLNIPRALFKNEDSPYFGPRHAKRDYYMKLPDVHELNKILMEYLNISRPYLLSKYHPNSKEHPLFITTKLSKSSRMTPRLISRTYTAKSLIYLVENKWRGTGIAQVKPHGTHAVRHMRGTSVIKKGGSFQMAGDANHISERMSRQHYIRFLPEERNERVNDILFGS
jgi:hypothetical protein